MALRVRVLTDDEPVAIEQLAHLRTTAARTVGRA